MNKYVLILAGGIGTRLWPISTSNRPKQFLSLYSSNIMINETINRIESLFDYDNIFIVVNKEQEGLAYKYIDYNVPRENIIVEPQAKNTAMCIFYASIIINKRLGNGVITILSSDHYVAEDEVFKQTISDGIKIAEKENTIVTIGIKPNYPATGFGYIKFINSENKKEFDVIEFKEKPNYDNALKYLESGEYYWNSGMFIIKLETIFNNFRKYLPKIYQNKKILENTNNKDIINKIYNEVEAISIDKGILEKTENIKMIKGIFEWYDIGNLNDFFKIKEKDIENNVKIGNVYTLDTQNTNIYNGNDEQLIVLLGNKNMNVINCNNVILISEKDKMNDLKIAIEELKINNNYKKFL